ncbi:MAG: metallophosphoesterase [Chlorobi bacterium]|nr:metallophosphoesterase [Chlorobiota bacterium]
MATIILVLILIDLLAWKGVRMLTSGMENTRMKKVWRGVFMGITLAFYILLTGVILLHPDGRDARLIRMDYSVAGIFLAIYVSKFVFVVFHVIEDIGWGILTAFRKVTKNSRKKNAKKVERISRRKFVSQAGLVLAGIPFASLIYGMTKGRFNFKVYRRTLDFAELPPSLNGLKIVQISDLHLGSMYGFQYEFNRVIDMIHAEVPDILFFTGDMVNYYTEEVNGWRKIFKRLHAPMGKFAILGNHDYGDYYHWNSPQEKEDDHLRLIETIRDMGFDLLLNENRRLCKKDTGFTVIGIENWGKPPFPQYGDLKEAMKGIHEGDFNILLSHDPTHWDAQVLGKTNIPLTLSGHTHGMQFGVRMGGKEWSPASMVYKRWGGLYRENNQMLYVNRGLGYIGYPGRVGMPPEITVLTLKKSSF